MKRKLAGAVIMLTLILGACSKKTIAAKDANVSTAAGSATSTTSETTPSESSNSSAEIAVTNANLLTSGKAVYETKCIRCHAMKPLTAFTEPRWDAILKVMAPKANLTQIEAQQVAAYVKANAKK